MAISREEINKRRKERRKELKAKGTCRDCYKPIGISTSSILCQKCVELNKEQQRKCYLNHISLGLCQKCGNIIDELGTSTRCSKCNEYHKDVSIKLKRLRLETGKCRSCGRPLLEDRLNKSQCSNCSESTFNFKWS